jgi:alkylhydroperoxidase/carboxymuconolactone decarboxylase family protein YurZ
MQWHIEQAIKEGATEKEVLEAIEVAIEMGIGPATVHARLAMEVMEQQFGKH